jgi:hypothetical protein
MEDNPLQLVDHIFDQREDSLGELQEALATVDSRLMNRSDIASVVSTRLES